MEILKLQLSEKINQEETKCTFMNLDGDNLVITDYLAESNGNFRFKTNNPALKSDYSAIGTCNLITVKDGLEQKVFKNVLQDKTRTLLVSLNELEEVFDRIES